jgi:hypothetical protein
LPNYRSSCYQQPSLAIPPIIDGNGHRVLTQYPLSPRLRRTVDLLPPGLRRLGGRHFRRLSRSFPALGRLLGPDTKRSKPGRVERLLPYPQFIIIGAPKCGTSWLRGALDQHPDILMVPDEIEYFSEHMDLPLEWYLEHFEQRIAAAPARSRSYVMGEKSARYCSIKLSRIKRLYRLLPEARLILMTRDPVSRHWAQAKRYFSKKRFDRYGGGVLSVPRDELSNFFQRMRPLSEYSQMIANWTAVFPPRRLLIVSQERTLAEPRATFDAVLDHIGLPRDYDPAKLTLLEVRKNRGPSIPIPDDIAESLEEMLSPERQRLRDLLGDRSFAYA